MPRSSADATRFTATGPHASSRSSHASTISFSEPPPNETPAQKVARLRAAAQAAKQVKLTTFDRIFLAGRKVADRAHRVTVTGLVVLSGASIIVAGWSLGSMMLYNRRKKQDFLAIQEVNYNKAVALAYDAERQGKLTEDLALILNKERALLQAESEEAERKSRGGIWQRTKTSLFGGLAKEEKPGGELGLASEQVKQAAAKHKNAVVAAQVGQMIMDSEDGDIGRRFGTIAQSPSSRKGGSLDRLGEQTSASITATAKSWSTWIMGRR